MNSIIAKLFPTIFSQVVFVKTRGRTHFTYVQSKQNAYILEIFYVFLFCFHWRINLIFSFYFYCVQCEPIPGLGFRRGSYKCVCRKGFYFPDTNSPQRYFNGSSLEEEYEKLMLLVSLWFIYIWIYIDFDKINVKGVNNYILKVISCKQGLHLNLLPTNYVTFSLFNLWCCFFNSKN